MKNSEKWITVLLITGASAWLFTIGMRNFAATKPSPSVNVSASNKTSAPAEEIEKLRLSADARDAKIRAEQEAAYTRKYHPDSQGTVMEFPERAIKEPEVQEKTAPPPEAVPPQDTPSILPIEDREEFQWNEMRRKYYLELLREKGKPKPEFKGSEGLQGDDGFGPAS